MKPLFQQIWHGDSIELCNKFKPGSVDCIITDPPFGVDNLSNFANTPEGKLYARKIANDQSPEIAISVFNRVMDALLPKAAENADMYIFTVSEVLAEWINVAKSMSRHGFNYKALLVWEKSGPGMGDLISWGQGTEFILFLKKGRRVSTAKRRSSVLHVPVIPAAQLIHPHEKPTELLFHFIEHSTDKHDFIVDPFGGSASLARAARKTDRSAVCIEMDENNYKLAKDKFDTEEEGLL